MVLQGGLRISVEHLPLGARRPAGCDRRTWYGLSRGGPPDEPHWPGFILTITREGDHLNAQATGQGIVPIFPESVRDFFVKVFDAQITFVTDSSGRATEIILYQNSDRSAKRGAAPGWAVHGFGRRRFRSNGWRLLWRRSSRIGRRLITSNDYKKRVEPKCTADLL
jgi:uncharacterized protein DUF3471